MPTAIRVKAWKGDDLMHGKTFTAAPASEHSANLHYQTWKDTIGITEVVKEERFGRTRWKIA
jgi:hypothetical protein